MEYRSRLRVLYAAVILGAASCASHAPEKTPDSAAADNAVISAALPDATSIRLQERGDLDADGDLDALLVLETTGGALARTEPRAVVIFLRNRRGTLQKVATGPRAILCRICGGAMGDPLQGVSLVRGGFVLRFEGGSRELWQRHYRFIHSPKARTWLLDAIGDKTIDRLDGNFEQRSTQAPALEPVPVETFDAGRFQDHTDL